MFCESSQAGALTSYTSSAWRSAGVEFFSGSGPKSYWVTSGAEEIGEIPHPAARPSQNSVMYTEGRRIALTGSVLEPRLARPQLAALRPEHEGLRVVVERAEHPVEGARLALQLFDQGVDPRQRLVVERAGSGADLLQAGRHAVEGGGSLLQPAGEPGDVGQRAARVADERGNPVGTRLEPLGERGGLARGLLDADERAPHELPVVLVQQVADPVRELARRRDQIHSGVEDRRMHLDAREPVSRRLERLARAAVVVERDEREPGDALVPQLRVGAARDRRLVLN